MTRLNRPLLIVLAMIASACSRSSTAPTGAASQLRSAVGIEPSSFGASIRAASSRGVVDFARCLWTADAPGCFGAAQARASGTVAAALVGAPTKLTASANGSTVSLVWGGPPQTAVVSYIIEAGSASGLSNLATISTGFPFTTFSASGVGVGRYYVRVRAVIESGEFSAPSNEALLVVDGSAPCTAPPGAPSGLALVSSANATVVLTWNAAPGGPNAYTIEAGTNTGRTNLANDVIGLTTSLTANQIGDGTYYVRVRARNDCGGSPASNEIVFTVTSRTTLLTTFGPGTYLVGKAIAPGRYYAAPASRCYFERDSGNTGKIAELLANMFFNFDVAQWIVDILPADVLFETTAQCGIWTNAPQKGVQETISAGMWLVGSQVAAGTYRAASARSGCSWQRLRDFTNAPSGIVDSLSFAAQDGPQTVTIAAGDAGFDTNPSCGTWIRAAAVSTEVSAR